MTWTRQDGATTTTRGTTLLNMVHHHSYLRIISTLTDMFDQFHSAIQDNFQEFFSERGHINISLDNGRASYKRPPIIQTCDDVVLQSICMAGPQCNDYMPFAILPSLLASEWHICLPEVSLLSSPHQ